MVMDLKLVKFRPIKFLADNIKEPSTYRVNTFRMLRCWVKGYSTRQVFLYNLTSSTCRNYLPEALKYRITNNTNKCLWPILHDKLIFETFMRDRIPLVPLLGFVCDGEYVVLQEGFTLESIYASVKESRRIVVKPLQGGGGVGIFFLSPADDGGVSVNGELHNKKSFLNWVSTLNYYGFYEHIKQHEVLANLYEETTNTLRITCFRPKAEEPKILGVSLRVGTNASFPVDNFDQGGINVDVDPISGKGGSAVIRDQCWNQEKIVKHPETGVLLEGVEVPFWTQIRESVINLHNQLPALNLVGWDVLIGQNGFYVIEGNHNPSLELPLVHRSLAETPGFREFCLSHKLM